MLMLKCRVSIACGPMSQMTESSAQTVAEPALPLMSDTAANQASKQDLRKPAASSDWKVGTVVHPVACVQFEARSTAEETLFALSCRNLLII